MKVIYKKFEDLSPKQLLDLLSLRQKVFIIEQACIYPDIDGKDEKANHLLFFSEEDQLAAYLRIFLPGFKYKEEASLGRIVVGPEFRGTGVGQNLIKKGIELCEGSPVRIEAQAPLKNYYSRFGFKPQGEIYIVDGIDHLQMVLD